MAKVAGVTEPVISRQEWDICLRVLHLLVDDPQAALNQEEIERLVARIYKKARRQRRKESERRRVLQDRESVAETERVRSYQGRDGRATEEAPSGDPPEFRPLRAKSRRCYICKQPYRDVHHFYHWLCPACARTNYDKRLRTVDLRGRVALVTGGRIKIGYQTALKLLRCGAAVTATTRFPKDAALRYSDEPDYDEWCDRLSIRQADFRDVRGLLRLVEQLLKELSSLDLLVNNAAQSVQRPSEYYAHLALIESNVDLSPNQKRLLAVDESGNAGAPKSPLRIGTGEQGLSIMQLDQHGEVIDTRDENSWTYFLDEISPKEVLEVLLVNVNAPFLLTSGLKPLFLRSSFRDRYVVNVTGKDGEFERVKSSRHPHINMTKAALNMMTRTSAADYAHDGIYMNSVDTGWITHEGSYSRRMEMRNRGFAPPLDEMDGAARILDPVVQGVDGQPVFGCLFRHYRPSHW